MIHFVDIPVIANSFGRKMEQPKSPITEPTHTHPRSQLNGSQILNKIINPTMARSIVPAVEMSVSPSPNVCPKTAMAATASTSVRPAGRAFNTTFVRKCPLITSLFGWNARKNPGIPIVNILISEICDGCNG